MHLYIVGQQSTYTFITFVRRRSNASLRLNIRLLSLMFAARRWDTVATLLRFLVLLLDFLENEPKHEKKLVNVDHYIESA